jgi:hypothetical protein
MINNKSYFLAEFRPRNELKLFGFLVRHFIHLNIPNLPKTTIILHLKLPCRRMPPNHPHVLLYDLIPLHSFGRCY